jgi:ribonuclease D
MMDATVTARPEIVVIETERALAEAVERAARAPAIAVDVEANGLFVYRPQLCTVQLAWEENEQTRVVVVDTLAVKAAQLAPLFGSAGPIKVLHDLTFDARMLDEAGAPLAKARDTSVAARMLGHQATGLAAVLAAELGVSVDKRFQQHDWSRRPLGAAELGYLGGDVTYLLALDRALAAKAEAKDIAPEIDEECAHKLRAAVAPPRDARPSYVRIKGAQKLDTASRAALRRLVLAREAAAEAADLPPFKVIGNEVLLELARRRPRTHAELGQVAGALSGRAGRYASRWLEAIALGVSDRDIPPEDQVHFDPPRMDRTTAARRREFETRISAFRRAEAARRGVDEQAILPGHCAQDLADILLSSWPGDPSLLLRIEAIAGLGARRFERYGATLASLLEARKPPEAVAAGKGEPGA